MIDIEEVKKEARKFSEIWIREGYQPEGLHAYSDGTDAGTFWKLRLKHQQTGDKKFIFIHRDGQKWVPKKPKLTGGDPLYNLATVQAKPEEIVVIVEGERCADLLNKFGIVATTSGGATSARSANWLPLTGRRALIWPDNDKDGASYAQSVRTILTSITSVIEEIDIEKLMLLEKEDVIDWQKRNPNASKLDILNLPRRNNFIALKEGEIAKKDNSIVVVNLHRLLSMSFPPREKILPWMSTQSLSMIHAWRGVGKTHIAIGIAYAIASGSKFLTWTPHKKTKVLYVDGEMPASAIQERLARVVNSSEVEAPEDGLRIITPDLQNGCVPDLATPEGQTQLEEVLGDSEVMIIDNLSCLARSGGNENDAESWNRVQEWALRLRTNGKSVLFIHHSGKSGQQRGTSKKEDVLDTVICLKHPSDYQFTDGACFEVHFEKARHVFGEELTPFIAKMEEKDGKQSWLTEPLEQSNFDKVVVLKNAGASQKEISQRLNIDKSTVSRHVKTASDQGLLLAANNNRRLKFEPDYEENDEEIPF